MNKIIATTLLLATLLMSSYAAIAADAQCVPSLLEEFKADVTALEGETALPVVTVFEDPQTPAADNTYPICKAVYEAHGNCVDVAELQAWKKAMRARKKAKVTQIYKLSYMTQTKSKAFEKAGKLLENDEFKTKIKAGFRPPKPVNEGEEGGKTKTEIDQIKTAQAAIVANFNATNAQANLATFITDNKSVTDKTAQKTFILTISIRIKEFLKAIKDSAAQKKYGSFFDKLFKMLVNNEKTYSARLTEADTHVQTWTTFKSGIDSQNPKRLLQKTTEQVPNDSSVKNDGDRAKEVSGTEGQKEDKEVKGKASKARGPCFTALNIIRGNALCLRTSGAAYKFFDASTDRYFVAPAMCNEVVPVCAPVFYHQMKVNRVLNVMIQIGAVMDSTADTTTLRDDTASDSEVTQWKECKDAEKDGCLAKTELVKTLCAGISLNDMNPKLEGSVTGSKFAEKSAEKIEKGEITEKTEGKARPAGGNPPAATRLRILAGTDGEASGSSSVDANGAGLESGGAFDSGDAEDAKESNAVDAAADKEVEDAAAAKSSMIVNSFVTIALIMSALFL